MTIQILVSTMHRTDYSLVEQMKIFADAIIINQCDRNDYKQFKVNGHTIDWYDCDERGVGKSRNKALMAATADICLFADDDMVYDDNAYNTVENAFSYHPDASLIVFNVPTGENKAFDITKAKRLRQWNAYRYGMYHFAIRRSDILKNRISVSLLFGGGAKYSCGEDSLFISDCFKNKLKLYAVPSLLGINHEGESTWFHGYTDKFFKDRGILYYAMSPMLSVLYCIRYVLTKKHLYIKDRTPKQVFSLMMQGIKEYKNS